MGTGMGTGTCWGRSHCRRGPTAPGLTTQGSCAEQRGPYRHPIARGQDSGEQYPMRAGMDPSPSPGSSSCPSQLWEMSWSLWRAAGTGGPQGQHRAWTCSGEGWQRRGSCRAGGLLGCPAAGGEGRGARRCALSSRRAVSGVLAGSEEGRAGPGQPRGCLAGTPALGVPRP